MPDLAAVSDGGAGRASSPLDSEALARTLRQLVEPLAALALARGLPFAALEETMKTAFVDAARAAHPELAPHRAVSRISTATGINRREVSRIIDAGGDNAAPKPSPATRVFTKWLAAAGQPKRRGLPATLPRQGPAPSFEALARSVTQDVHPRSLLDEMCRLGLASVDGDAVHLVAESFVPRSDAGRMLGFVGSNVGDHLQAAVANVLADEPRHLEQAVFADGLSPASIEAFRAVMRVQWKQLLDATVPALQALIDADRAAGRAQDQRVRVGLYSFSAPMATASEPTPSATRTPRRPAQTKNRSETR